MKKTTLSIFSLTLLLIAGNASAQTWCTPPTCSPFPCAGINTYGSTSPVITNVTFNTINRSSTTSQKELYVNTGVSTAVNKGQTYSFSMTYSMDAGVCATYNTRIWIDWNGNFSFADAGELVLQTNASSSGTLSGSITIPSSATVGTTRMRVVLKMDIPCGHTAPDPCLVTDNSSVGWHGEVEDYTLNISAGSGINELNGYNVLSIFPNPIFTSATITVSDYVNFTNAQFVVYDVLGKEIDRLNVPSGTKSFSFARNGINNGFYFYKLISDNTLIGTGKLVVE